MRWRPASRLLGVELTKIRAGFDRRFRTSRVNANSLLPSSWHGKCHLRQFGLHYRSQSLSTLSMKSFRPSRDLFWPLRVAHIIEATAYGSQMPERF